MYNAIDVANYIVNKSIDLGTPVSNLKLQKLLYYVQAAKLVNDNVAMFKEKISAWKYGPAVESVFHEFKFYANMKIDEKCNSDDIIAAKDKALIDEVLQAYREVIAIDMVRKSCNEDPWKNAYKNKEAYISLEAIQSYYRNNEGSIYNLEGGVQ